MLTTAPRATEWTQNPSPWGATTSSLPQVYQSPPPFEDPVIQEAFMDFLAQEDTDYPWMTDTQHLLAASSPQPFLPPPTPEEQQHPPPPPSLQLPSAADLDAALYGMFESLEPEDFQIDGLFDIPPPAEDVMMQQCATPPTPLAPPPPPPSRYVPPHQRHAPHFLSALRAPASAGLTQAQQESRVPLGDVTHTIMTTPAPSVAVSPSSARNPVNVPVFRTQQAVQGEMPIYYINVCLPHPPSRDYDYETLKDPSGKLQLVETEYARTGTRMAQDIADACFHRDAMDAGVCYYTTMDTRDLWHGGLPEQGVNKIRTVQPEGYRFMTYSLADVLCCLDYRSSSSAGNACRNYVSVLPQEIKMRVLYGRFKGQSGGAKTAFGDIFVVRVLLLTMAARGQARGGSVLRNAFGDSLTSEFCLRLGMGRVYHNTGGHP